MLHLIATYTHMPKPLIVFGALFILYAIFPLSRTIREGYFSGILSGIWFYIKKYYIALFCFLIAVGLVICFIDLPMAKLSKNLYNIDVYTIADFVNSMGEGWFIISVLFTLSIIYQFCNRQRLTIIFKMAYVAAIYAGLFNAVLKFIFNRERPSIGLKPFNFFYFFISGDKQLVDLTYAYNSMPSGHTITAFAAMIPLLIYIKSAVIRGLILSFAIAIAIARVYTMNHWFSDVCVSAILGVIIGLSIYKANEYRIAAINV